ncbi:MAG: fructose PTS transporter subunit IIA, partial [Staphylococcus equorum]|nr:fructose PTS transporter subunit IIA [Staphylococcus equorum]
SFTMGLFGITEGAIPFAAQDPLRIIPSNMIGAMIAAAIAAIGGVGDRVAHGGPIVAVLGGIDQVLWFFIAVIVGSVVTMFSVLTLRRKTPAIAGDAAHTDAGMAAQTQNDTEVATQNSAEISEDKQATTDDEIEVFQQEVIEISEKKLTRDEAIEHLVGQLNKYDYITDAEKLKADVLKREMESTTAIGMNVAVPHAKSDAVKKPIVAVMNNKQGVNWDSLDGTLPKIVFLIAVPSDSSDTHLKLLQRLSRALMDDDIRQSLIDATHTEQIYDILKEI